MIRCLLLLFVLSHAAFAQGTAEDYRRADTIASRWNGLLRNADVRVRWVDAATPVYQIGRAHV